VRCLKFRKKGGEAVETALARDWTLERVREEAELVWATYRRERQDEGEAKALENRIKALRKITGEATENGSLKAEEVREVLMSVASGALTTRPA
jgi:hypothetical protein